MISLATALTALSRRRRVFHSEADFQHELAWEIRQQCPACGIRLEVPLPGEEGRAHLDILVRAPNTTLALELKYKTRKLQVTVDGEQFDLTDQIAHPIGRYDFLKDVERLERFVSSRSDATGHAVFLTNDSAYCDAPRSDDTVDAAFRTHQGGVVTGRLKWGSRASEGTMRNRERPIRMSGSYRLSWRDYSDLGDESYSRFRYLLVEVRV